MAFLIIFYFLFKLLFINYVPFWDGWANSGEVIYHATTTAFNFFNFELVGHSSFGYLFLISVLQYLSPGNIALIHFSVTLLSAVSIYVFNRILSFLIDGKKFKFETLVLTFLYAFFPIIVASSLHINIDYGVMLFFIFFLYALMSGKNWLSVLSGTGMMFSKETGAGIYLATLFCYFILFLPRKNKKWLYFLVPPALFILRVFAVVSLNAQGLWFMTFANSLTSGMGTPGFDANVIARIPYSYALGIFVVNFNWILSLVILAGTGVIFKKRNSVFLFYVLILNTLVLTVFKTFTNLRYFLPLYPLMILLWGTVITSYFKNAYLRRAILGVTVFVFFVSNFYTFDPISRNIYGSFDFGQHKILKMTSITGECCGYGRDQLIYNLETIPLHYLTEEVFRDIKPDADTYFAYSPSFGPEVMFNFDKYTFNRTIDRTNTIIPKSLNWTLETVNPKPQKVYYLEFPLDDNKSVLARLKNYYDVKYVKNYRFLDFELRVDFMALKKSFS